MIRNLVFGLVIVLVLARGAAAQEPAFDPELPPVVVKTVPAAGEKEVDSSLTEIRVTFDRPMQTENAWSWIIHQNLGIYPGIKDGPDPRWEDDGRTCVLPVKLLPGRLYAVGANSFRHTGFRDLSGLVAVPFAWVFKTRNAE